MVYELAEMKDATKIEGSEELARIAEGLGLDVQARRWRKARVEDVFTPLTADEWEVWGAYCPTVYLSEGKDVALLRDYAFDTIPPEVLRHWGGIKDRFAFERYSIHTTERTGHKDPILLGWFGPMVYLLARWADESPGMLSFVEVARRVMLQRVRPAWENVEVWREVNRPRATAARISRAVEAGYWPEIAAAMRVLGLPSPLRGEDVKMLLTVA